MSESPPSDAQGCHAMAAPEQDVVVLLPKGTYHTGSLVIPSRTTLRLDRETTLLASVSPTDYPLVGALEALHPYLHLTLSRQLSCD